MARFIDRLHSALTDLAKGWGLSGESESAVPSMFAEPDDILRAVTEALRGQYSVEEQIGAGGMALVFRARDLKHDRQVALKVLRPELASQVGRERFLQEIRLAAQLSHPHILPLHDSGVAGGLLYYMMPYVEGETLRQRLDREGRLTLEEAVDITRSVAGALDFAHRQGVVHRDIKPENIMVHDGVAMVTDFGISKVLSEVGGEQLTQAGTAMGTPAYMSPEQIFGEDNVDGRSDVYSLALVVFELLTGNRLFTGSSARAILGRRAAYPEPGLEFPWDVPNTVRDAVRAALAESPETRRSGVNCGLTVHQYEWRRRERLLQRRHNRGDHQRAHSARWRTSRGAHIVLRAQGCGRGCQGSWLAAWGGHRVGRHRAPSGKSPAHYGATHQL